MTRLLILAAMVALTGCSLKPVDVECSVNDTIVFVAPGVTSWDVSAGTLHTWDSRERRKMARRMQENETCSEVQP